MLPESSPATGSTMHQCASLRIVPVWAKDPKLNQATDDWHTARVTLSGAQGLVCRREAALGSA